MPLCLTYFPTAWTQYHVHGLKGDKFIWVQIFSPCSADSEKGQHDKAIWRSKPGDIM